MFFLTSQANPFSSLSSIDDIAAAVNAGDRPQFAAVDDPHPPPTVAVCQAAWRKVVEDCWASDPAARPTFETLSSRTLWDNILLDASLAGQTKLMDLWKSMDVDGAESSSPRAGADSSAMPTRIAWPVFVDRFLGYLGLTATGKEVEEDLKYRCLKAALQVDSLYQGSPAGYVYLPRFEMFFVAFGPIEKGAAGGTISLVERSNDIHYV